MSTLDNIVALMGGTNFGDIHIEWYHQYGNSADLKMPVTEHAMDRLRAEPFTVVHEYEYDGDIGRLVVARKHGLAKFQALCSVERGGYGGHAFDMPIYTGDEEVPVITLRTGAWSSNAASINESLPCPYDHVLEVNNHAMEVPLVNMAVRLWNEEHQGMGGEAVLVYDLVRKQWTLRWVEYGNVPMLMLKPEWEWHNEPATLNRWNTYDSENFMSYYAYMHRWHELMGVTEEDYK